MLKTYLILLILFLIASCNNKMEIGNANSNKITLPPPEPYHLLGNLSSNFGIGGVAQYNNPFAANRDSNLKYSLESSDGYRYNIGFGYEATNVTVKSVIFKADSETAVLDTSFAASGFFTIPSGAAAANQNDNVWDATIINDRYLLICGYEDAAGGRKGTVKLFDTQTEAMVASFGTAGILLFSSADGARPNAFVSKCAYDSQNNAIVVSHHEYGGNLYRSFLSVIDFTGANLASFNGGSRLPITHASLTGEVANYASLVVTATNYYVAGSQHDAGWTYDQSFVAKYDKTGALVNSFGTNGVKLYTASADATNVTIYSTFVDQGDFFYSLATDYDGANYGLVKISKSTGDIDLGFGTTGFLDFKSLVSPQFGPFVTLWISDLKLTADGKIIISWVDEAFPVATQIDTNGNLDASFGTNGSLALATPAGTTQAYTWSISKNLDDTFSFQGPCFDAASLRRFCNWKIE